MWKPILLCQSKISKFGDFPAWCGEALGCNKYIEYVFMWVWNFKGNYYVKQVCNLGGIPRIKDYLANVWEVCPGNNMCLI